MLHFAFRAAAKAAASCGRLSSASGLELGIFGGDQQRLDRGKSLNCGPLRLNPESRALLLLS
jgi:hypothetical protein